MLIFPMVIQGDEVLRHVFPSKQKAVQAAVELAKSDERIERLIVFGSAVTMDCGMESDIDLAVDAHGISDEEFLKMARNFYLNVPSELDMVCYDRIQSRILKKEIDTKGVCVYAKRS